MNILFAVQGTGNGHISRATDLIPAFRKHGRVDVLVSGRESAKGIPFEVDILYKGFTFLAGESGGIDYLKTISHMHACRVLKELMSLSLKKYDLIVSDFEPVSAWASKLQRRNCSAVSHHNAIFSQGVPQPAITDPMTYAIIKTFAPASRAYGLHFQQYNQQIYTPVIRKEIRRAKPEDKGHITVYLPAYGENVIVKHLSAFPGFRFEVFCRGVDRPRVEGNVQLCPVSHKGFTDSIIKSAGVICGAGFETPAEALHLGKKLLVIPMRGQFEQECNAYALGKMGVTVWHELSEKQYPKLREWLEAGRAVHMHYPDTVPELVERVIWENARFYDEN